MQTNPDYRSFGAAVVVLAAVGWSGLVYLVGNTLPGLWPRWLFFVLLVLALTGSAGPFAWYLNRRFAPTPVPAHVLLRQSLWVGLFGATCAWLQIARTLNFPLVALLLAGLAGVEWFLRMREQARWTPGGGA